MSGAAIRSLLWVGAVMFGFLGMLAVMVAMVEYISIGITDILIRSGVAALFMFCAASVLLTWVRIESIVSSVGR